MAGQDDSERGQQNGLTMHSAAECKEEFSKALISLDFSGVALTTQSYIHALLAEPFRVLGKDNLQERVRFIACNTQLKEVILIVMGYVLDE